MKYLKKVAELPQTLEEGVLYLNSTDGSVSLKKKEELVPPTPTVEVVDLGLPSGTKWMKYNVGANSETEYGLLFQWGDTVGYDDASHSTWETTPFNNGSSEYNETYFASVKDTVCPNGFLASQYDAASVATSGVAHMPTQADFEELTANTTVEWVTDFNGSGVNGRKFTNKTDTAKYIFIPASGSAYYDSVNDRGSFGYVWTSSLCADYPSSAWYLDFDSGYMSVNYYDRCRGFSVRGVVSK